MPIDYKKYHPDWKQIRAAILERDGNRCKFCGVGNHWIGFRRESGEFVTAKEMTLAECLDSKIKTIKIVLTVAHLDHDIANNDHGNLAALCQRCHLRYDAQHHAKNAKATRKAKKQAQTGQIELFT